jgi:preprotein translocase subunit SecE
MSARRPLAGMTSFLALAIAPCPRYLAKLACIGKARLTGPPVEGGCPKGAAQAQAGKQRTTSKVARVNPGEFLRQVRAETGKVSWPTRKETVTTGIMVLIMTSLLGIFFFGVDNAFAALVSALLGLLG